MIDIIKTLSNTPWYVILSITLLFIVFFIGKNFKTILPMIKRKVSSSSNFDSLTNVEQLLNDPAFIYVEGMGCELIMNDILMVNKEHNLGEYLLKWVDYVGYLHPTKRILTINFTNVKDLNSAANASIQFAIRQVYKQEQIMLYILFPTNKISEAYIIFEDLKEVFKRKEGFKINKDSIQYLNLTIKRT